MTLIVCTSRPGLFHFSAPKVLISTHCISGGKMGKKPVEDEKIRKTNAATGKVRTNTNRKIREGRIEKLEKELAENAKLVEKLKQLKAGKDSYFLLFLVDNILCFQRRGKKTGITKWNRVSEF